LAADAEAIAATARSSAGVNERECVMFSVVLSTSAFGVSGLGLFGLWALCILAMFAASSGSWLNWQKHRHMFIALLIAMASAAAASVYIIWDCGWLPDWACWL
jgi:hypothetical protein